MNRNMKTMLILLSFFFFYLREACSQAKPYSVLFNLGKSSVSMVLVEPIVKTFFVFVLNDLLNLASKFPVIFWNASGDSPCSSKTFRTSAFNRSKQFIIFPDITGMSISLNTAEFGFYPKMDGL